MDLVVTLVEKIKKTLISCATKEQLKSAWNMVGLSIKSYPYIMTEEIKQELIEIYIDKDKELFPDQDLN